MIGFLHPWALAGLAATAIPLLLHLLARREPPTVLFPAVRYLVTTTREHQRRLKLQHLLLLLVRTALVAALVMAAAGPNLPLRGVAGHAPSALAVILDNSPSSGTVVSGTPRLAQLQAAARTLLARATADDALWLITADGIPRRGDARMLDEQVRGLGVSPFRLDLGAAVGVAGQVLAVDPRAGEIVVLSDLQASALSPARTGAPVLVGRPADPPPANVGVSRLETGAQPWSSDGGRITAWLTGDSGAPVALSARIGDRPPRQVLAAVGGAAALTLPGAPSGWWTAAADLDPDELRADDHRIAVVRVAPVARVSWDSAGQYASAACAVLEANHRIAEGGEVTLGRLARGNSIVLPPEDPAALGALNRALAGRGIGWSFGPLSLEPVFSDSGPAVPKVRVLRRYRLQPTASGRTGVLATAAGSPWMVRSGNVVLLGSRLEPAWTELPVAAGFMPFMDLLLNRLARGEVTLVDAAPGDPVRLPDQATRIRQGRREWRVEGGSAFRPLEPGAYYILAGDDTVGAIGVNPDPRESALRPARDAQVARLWRGARVMDLREAAEAAFAGPARSDLRGPLLWLALVMGLTELGLASAWSRRS